MKKHLLNVLAVAFMLLLPALGSAQPTLGTAKDFVLFSTNGAVSNVGSGTLTLLTGNVGTNGSTVTSGFGNVDGVILEGRALSIAGAIALQGGVTLEGRAMTITGSIASAVASAHMPPGCTLTAIRNYNDTKSSDAVTLYPNPVNRSTTIMIKDASLLNNYELRIYNIRGTEVMSTTITNESTTLEIGNLPSGVYFYKMNGRNKTVKSGKMILQH